VSERALARPAAIRLRAAVAAPSVAPALVGALMLAAFVSRVLLDRYVLAPWEMVDELQYASASRSFLSGGHYLFREHAASMRTIYPALISPAWLADSTQTAYTLIKTINAALMTLGAIPLYLWARRLVAPLWGVLAVALYLAIPGFIYTAEILTENAFVPATILALFAISVALERPTLLQQLLALGAIALTAAARIQGLVFLLVLPTAIALSLLFDAIASSPGERRRVITVGLRRFWPSLAALALGAVAYVAWERARGASLSSGLGMYRQVSQAQYELGPALRWIAYHFGELVFSVGVIPVSALIVLVGLACRRATAPSPPERAFLAAATAAVFWIVVQVGTFASHFSLRVEERYMFNVAPALLLALVVWLARGLPRPRGLVAAAVLVPAAFVLTLPFGRLFTQALFNDTYGLIPLWRLSTRLSLGTTETRIVAGVGALAAGLLFAFVPRRWARAAVPSAVAGFLVLSSGSVFATVTWLSASARHAGNLSGDPSWIDHTVGRDARVDVLFTRDIVDRHVVWEAEFWNRSVRRVFGVTAEDLDIPDVAAPVDPAGRIVPALPVGSPDLHPRYVAGDATLAVEGAQIASAGQLGLWRVHQPLRLRSISGGITPDNWTASTWTYTRYVVPPGARSLVIRVSRPGTPPSLPQAHVEVTVGPAIELTVGPPGATTLWARKFVTVRSRQKVLRLPLRGRPFRVQVSTDPIFSPAQFGLPDTRKLGVKIAIRVR
jgi:hypothetical protein